MIGTTWVLFLASCAAFNLDPRHSIILKDPKNNNNSYFGYSLAFHQRNKEGPLLVVGAPNGFSSNASSPKIPSGTVYLCHQLNSISAACKDDSKRFLGQFWSKVLDNAWFGATVESQGSDGLIAVCAPKFSNDKEDVHGQCFINDERNNITTNSAPWDNEPGFFMHGFSAQFSKYKKGQREMLIGAPGFHRTGQVLQYSTPNFQGKNDIGHGMDDAIRFDSYYGFALSSSKFLIGDNIASATVVSSPKSFNNLAKISDDYYGLVYVWFKSNSKHYLHGEKFGEYFGFSLLVMASSADNTKTVDDLIIVGAPLYHVAGGVDQGRIYVFLNDNGRFSELTGNVPIMGSESNGARFGSALVCIGDINQDNFNDIAVSAPYEENGAVYIYHGKKDGIENQYSQKITASMIDKSLNGFGFSLAGGIDVDGNNVPDMAVGSVFSANAVIIKSYPVIHIKGSLQSNVGKLNTSNLLPFTVEACLNYTSVLQVNKPIEVSVTFNVDAKAKIKRANKYTVTSLSDYIVNDINGNVSMVLTQDTTKCLNLTVHLLSMGSREEVVIEMNYTLKNDPLNRTDYYHDKMKSPVLDPKEKNLVTISVPFNNWCKSTKCEVDLRVEARIEKKGGKIIHGEFESVTLDVNVTNTKDPAYVADLIVSLPAQMLMTHDCHGQSEEGNSTVCHLSSPLPPINYILANNMTYKEPIKFELDMTHFSAEQPNLKFNVTVDSPDEGNETRHDNTVEIDEIVYFHSAIDIYGDYRSERYVKKDPEVNETELIQILHTYRVRNKGPSPVTNAAVHILIPTMIKVKSGEAYQILNDTKIQRYIDMQESQCEKFDLDSGFGTKDMSGNANVPTEYMKSNFNCTVHSCMIASCKIENLRPEKTNVRIELRMWIDVNVIRLLLQEQKTINLSTNAVVTITNSSLYLNDSKSIDYDSTYTLIMEQFEMSKVPIWQIVLAAIVGAALFSGAVVMLKKAGFFKRADKEKLKNLKQDNAGEANDAAAQQPQTLED